MIFESNLSIYYPMREGMIFRSNFPGSSVEMDERQKSKGEDGNLI